LLYGHTHENLRNCASDWPDCTSAERHEQTTTSISVQHWELYTKTYVGVIVAGDINLL